MKVIIKYLNKIQEFDNENNITIGKNNCDFNVEQIPQDVVIKLIYTDKYKNFIVVNQNQNTDVLLNNKTFSKILAGNNFNLQIRELKNLISVSIIPQEQEQNSQILSTKTITQPQLKNKNIFDCEIETNRITIIKEIGYKITELKNSIQSMNIISFILNVSMIILSVVCGFGMTNFLLGLKIDNSTSVLNLTTNAGFLVCISTIAYAIASILKYGIYSLMEFNRTKRLGDSDIAQKFIIFTALLFMFMVYIINLFYYKDIPGFSSAAFFISVLFAGSLTTVAASCGYFKFQLKTSHAELTDCEYREDFESVMKSYRTLIHRFINELSQNRINSIKGNLLNNQLKMIVEVFIGILTSPFLAYGVSNTLAGCFPEAANWVRISGLRFSPVFLVLATFMIIFAFFSFVRAFTISKQIKGSEIIKFDGFHDFISHGVNILGLDSIHNLTKEKNIVMSIACFIIMIEFTMNVSYFITEIGGDIQGMFLSFVTALVPTALLIAETHLLSSTMYKINNYNELLSTLD